MVDKVYESVEFVDPVVEVVRVFIFCVGIFWLQRASRESVWSVLLTRYVPKFEVKC